jgi:hypothetical protein
MTYEVIGGSSNLSGETMFRDVPVKRKLSGCQRSFGQSGKTGTWTLNSAWPEIFFYKEAAGGSNPSVSTIGTGIPFADHLPRRQWKVG